METGWLILFILSVGILAIVIYRTKPNLRWFGYAMLQLVISAVILFIMNGTGLLGDFYIPINLTTVLTIAILGVPGLAMLAVMKVTLL